MDVSRWGWDWTRFNGLVHGVAKMRCELFDWGDTIRRLLPTVSESRACSM